MDDFYESGAWLLLALYSTVVIIFAVAWCELANQGDEHEECPPPTRLSTSRKRPAPRHKHVHHNDIRTAAMTELVQPPPVFSSSPHPARKPLHNINPQPDRGRPCKTRSPLGRRVLDPNVALSLRKH